MHSLHIPIMTHEVMTTWLEPVLDVFCKSLPVLVDATVGGGGHLRAMIEVLEQKQCKALLLACDQDRTALERAQKGLEDLTHHQTILWEQIPFSLLDKVLHRHGIPVVHGIFADIGFSSDQIESPERGLSFQKEGPLDMRLSHDRTIRALDLLMTLSEKELHHLFETYGEARFARTIARHIVHVRATPHGLPQTTTAFAEWIRSHVPKAYRYRRIHPATQIFQALRIAVNHELEELDALLSIAQHMLSVDGGRLGVLTFHSLEDRKVKHAFAKKESWKNIFKKPLIASQQEVAQNPRARSCKWRVAQRC